MAQYNLGDMYWDGQAVAKDKKKTLEWYMKAAKQGNSGFDSFAIALAEFSSSPPISQW